jgi:hypothetical protein
MKNFLPEMHPIYTRFTVFGKERMKPRGEGRESTLPPAIRNPFLESTQGVKNKIPVQQNFIGILFLFMIYILFRLRRVFCQNMLELIKGKSVAKNYSARKSRKREDNDDCIKEIPPHRAPKRSSKKRQSQPILNSIRLSGEKDILFTFTPNTTETPLR